MLVANPRPAHDRSNGNDMIIAKPGINSMKGLKGKKIGLEIGLVDHLLLQKGLEKFSMKESDVTARRTSRSGEARPPTSTTGIRSTMARAGIGAPA
jgi:ABC-type nitrate/sulfonate/bicarbonate transport system substrate-binding protein